MNLVRIDNNPSFFQELHEKMLSQNQLAQYKLVEKKGAGFFLEKKGSKTWRWLYETINTLFYGYTYKIDEHAKKFIKLGQKAIKQMPSVEAGQELLACSKSCRQVAHLVNNWVIEENITKIGYTAFKKAALGLELDPLQLAFHNNERAYAKQLMKDNPHFADNFLSPDTATFLLKIAYEENALDHIFEAIRAGAQVAETELPRDEYLWKAVYYNDEAVASALIDQGASVNSRSEPTNQTLLQYACGRGQVDIVRVLLEKRADVTLEDLLQKTALHYAVGIGNKQIVTLLRPHANFTARDFHGRTPYQCNPTCLSITNEMPFKLERALLNDDIEVVLKEMKQRPEERAQFEVELAALRTKYPKTPLTKFEYSYLLLDSSHYKKAIVDVTIPQPPAHINLNKLLDFDDNEETKEKLKEFIQNVEGRVVRTGTPKARTPQLETFYSNIENALKNCIAELQRKDNPEKRKELIQEIASAAPHCAGRYYTVAIQQFLAICKNKILTLDEMVYQSFAEYRQILFENLVDRNDAHNVNDYTYLVRKLGKKYGIPGSDLFNEYEDPYGRVNIRQAEKKFLSLYHPAALLDWIEPIVKAEWKEAFTNWHKANIPASWRKANFGEIRRHVAQLLDKATIDAYLREKEIFVRPGITPIQAVDEECESAYLGTIVYNMETGEIKREAVIDMLVRIGVLSSLFSKPEASYVPAFLKRAASWFHGFFAQR